MQTSPAQPSHWGHIYSNFIHSLRSACSHVQDMSGQEIGQLLTNLVARDWTVTVAELEGKIVGWVLHGPGKQELGWVFVDDKLGFRGQGAGKYLVQSVGINMSLAVYSPFVPNRSQNCPLRLNIRHRPYLTVARPVNVQ